jgi:hypothetical protein
MGQPKQALQAVMEAPSKIWRGDLGKWCSDVTMQHYAPINFLDDVLSQCLEDFIHWVSFAQDPPHLAVDHKKGHCGVHNC